MSAGDVQAGEAKWKRWVVWAGRAVSLWPIYVLVSSASWKLGRTPWYVAEWARIGNAENTLTPIGLIQVACIVLYVIPYTSVLGTVLLTGYLGGAIATYVRIGEFNPVMVPLSTCLTAWLGLYLREERLWSLLPIRMGIRRP
jgi:hypothetical protein